MGRVAAFVKSTTQAWWFLILTLASLLGSFITEPAAMTIAALLLAKQFYDYNPTPKFAYATIVTFERVCLWNLNPLRSATSFNGRCTLGLGHCLRRSTGWKAVIGVVIAIFSITSFSRMSLPTLCQTQVILLTPTHLLSGKIGKIQFQVGHRPPPLFMAWTVFTAHHPPLFIGGFLFFIGFTMASESLPEQTRNQGPLLVGFFLAGLVTHVGFRLVIAPVLQSLSGASDDWGNHLDSVQ